MTSQKQTDANRRNSLLSTGPRTEYGKRASRQNAVRHGLTAETVIFGIEDAAEYASFEAEIVGEYDPKSVVERELTRRLASLLWRLRRANLIESGLLSIYSEKTPDREKRPDFARRPAVPVSAALIRRLSLTATRSYHDDQHDHRNEDAQTSDEGDFDMTADRHRDKQQAIATCFLRLAELSSQPLERISRYEAMLWRQFVQVLFALDQAKYHRITALPHRLAASRPTRRSGKTAQWRQLVQEPPGTSLTHAPSRRQPPRFMYSFRWASWARGIVTPAPPTNVIRTGPCLGRISSND